MVKKIHLSVEEIKEKIAKLEVEKSTLETVQNKTKRKRIYTQLAKLQKALGNP
jgi:predicted nuclease with TOPRIM domain